VSTFIGKPTLHVLATFVYTAHVYQAAELI